MIEWNKARLYFGEVNPELVTRNYFVLKMVKQIARYQPS